MLLAVQGIVPKCSFPSVGLIEETDNGLYAEKCIILGAVWPAALPSRRFRASEAIATLLAVHTKSAHFHQQTGR